MLGIKGLDEIGKYILLGRFRVCEVIERYEYKRLKIIFYFWCLWKLIIKVKLLKNLGLNKEED